MDHFNYRDGALYAEDVAIGDIAAAVGTPFYCYSTATMVRHYRVLADAFAGTDALICYAIKANSNQAVIATLVGEGAGCDVISGGELQRALAAGCPPERIVFAGPGKTPEELAFALDIGIHQFNVESEPELRTLSAIAAQTDKTAPVAVRVNPDVDAQTHEKISTGRKQDKFGIPAERALEIYDLGRDLPGVEMLGVALHIGSQLTQLAPYEAAFQRALDLVADLRRAGHDIRRFNVGGGLGIRYGDETPPSPQDYADLVLRQTHGSGLEVALEPGRVIVGNAGVLVARVIYDKHEGKRFIIADAAMNDLIRPALYDSTHDVVPVTLPGENTMATAADLVGPVCESGDFLARDQDLPPMAPDDLIAIRSAGAYGSVMASTYNSRPLVAEVLVKGDQFAVVRPRQTIEDLIGRDRTPDWLNKPTLHRGAAG